MKKQTEKRLEQATKQLLETLDRNIKDIEILLDEFEVAHDEGECEESRSYSAMVGGYVALSEAKERVINRLNK